MKTKKRVVNKKLTTEHPAVKLARHYLRDYQALSKISDGFSLPMNGLLNVLDSIIRAK